MANNNKCCICGKPFDDMYKMGNNAMPFRKGYCCDECNKKYVIPSRDFSYDVKNKIITLLIQAEEDIDSGKVKLNPPDIKYAGYKMNESKLPKKLKTWRKNYFIKLCRKDKNIYFEACKLLTTSVQKKGIECVGIDYFAKDGVYGFRLEYD